MLADFVGAARLELLELGEPAGGIVDFDLRFGDFQIDPVGKRVIVHDHFDDRERQR